MEENKWEIISQNLDRIKKLGYLPVIHWKSSVFIYQIVNDSEILPDDPLLVYQYFNDKIDWGEAIEQTIDIFYSWYYDRGIEINNLLKENDDYIIDFIGDVTDQVNRELNLTNILDEKKKWDF